MFYLTCVAVESSIVPSYMDYFPWFSGYLLPVLIYGFKVRNICLSMVMGGTMLRDGTGG